MQIQCADALLQGPGHRFGAMGPGVCAVVQEEPHGGGLGRAYDDQEETYAVVSQGCCRGFVPVPLGWQQIIR